MFILNKFTWSSLVKNKKRSIVTLIGVILSCALICGTVILGESIQDMLVQTAVINSGNYHVLFDEVQYRNADAVLNSKHVQQPAITQQVGYSKLADSVNTYKPFLYVNAYDSQAFETFNVKVVSGRLPKNSDEVIISQHIIDNAQVEMRVGDVLALNIGQRLLDGEVLTQNHPFREEESFQQLTESREYKIVGIMARMNVEPVWAAGYTVLTALDPAQLAPDEQVRIFTRIDRPRRIYDYAPQIAEQADVSQDNIKYNDNYLRMMGISRNQRVNRALMIILSVLISLIIIASVALIFNSFAISVSERKKQFGLLKSIGATPKQIRKIVYKEAAIIGAISMPLGILGGILGIWVVLRISNNLMHNIFVAGTHLNLIVSPYVVISTILFLGLTLLISAWIPAKRAAQISPIDSIRQTEDIKLKTRRRGFGSKLVTRLFGFEADLANKSIKRNRKKYRITVFSLAISIIMFIVFSTFVNGTIATVGSVYSQSGFNIMIWGDLNYDKAQETVSVIEPSENVEQLAVARYTTIESPLAREKFNDYILETFENMIQKDGDKYLASIRLVELADADFKLFLQQQGLNEEDYFDPDNPRGIYVKKSSFVAGRVYKIPVLEIAAGDMIIEGNDQVKAQLQVGAVVTEPPFAVPPSGTSSTMIVSRAVSNQVLSAYSITDEPYRIVVQAHQPDQFENYFVNSEIGKKLRVINYESQEAMNKRMNTFIALLCYGFITIITLIGVTNIFNTINTNIMLRRREFAMLKSVGLTPRGFDKMLNFESIFYGIGAIIWAFPIGLFLASLLNSGFYDVLASPVSRFNALPWNAVLQSGVFVIALAFIITRYSIAKVKRENIIDALRSENI